VRGAHRQRHRPACRPTIQPHASHRPLSICRRENPAPPMRGNIPTATWRLQRGKHQIPESQEPPHPIRNTGITGTPSPHPSPPTGRGGRSLHLTRSRRATRVEHARSDLAAGGVRRGRFKGRLEKSAWSRSASARSFHARRRCLSVAPFGARSEFRGAGSRPIFSAKSERSAARREWRPSAMSPRRTPPAATPVHRRKRDPTAMWPPQSRRGSSTPRCTASPAPRPAPFRQQALRHRAHVRHSQRGHL
jgi:hypothetical protein